MMSMLTNRNPVSCLAAALVAAVGFAAPVSAGIIGRAVVGNQLYYLNDNGALTTPKTISYQAYSGIGYIGLAKWGSNYAAVSRAGAYSNFYPQQVFSIADTGSTATAGLMNNTNWNMFTEGDCAVDPTTGDMWALKPGGQLYRFVNNTFNNGTLIGTIPGVVDASAMAFTTGGNLYVLDFSSNGRISRIDKTNASIISSAYSTIPLYSCDAGMYFNPANGSELIISANGISGNNTGQLLMKTNASTGAAAFMGQTTPAQGIVVTSGSSGGPCFWWHNILLCAVEAVDINFNTYTDMQRVAGQSMWQVDTTAFADARDARVITTPADPVNPPRTVASIDAGTAIAQIGDFRTGRWTMEMDTYIASGSTPTPGAVAGISLLSNINLQTGERTEGATLAMDTGGGVVFSPVGLARPLVRDQWVPVRFDIDLDADRCSAYYNREPLFENLPWTGGQPGTPAAIKGLSLWNANASSILVGSVRLMPTGATPRCVADVDDGSATGTPDNGVTIDDLLYYLATFEAGEPSADVDDGSATGTQDGGVTIDDLLYYLLRFESGC